MLLVGQTRVVKGGADVEDGSFGGLYVLRGGLGEVEGAEEVDLDNGAEGVVRQALERSQEVAGSTVDQVVNATQLLDRELDSSLDLVGLADISRGTPIP